MLYKFASLKNLFFKLSHLFLHNKAGKTATVFPAVLFVAITFPE